MRALSVCALLGGLAACGGGGGGTVPTTTVMVFMAADNDLEPFAIEDLNEMEVVGSTEHVRIVVEVDTLTMPVGGSTTTKRLLVQPDDDADLVTSPVLQDLGEIDTAAAAAISSFVAWAVATYPADRYVLILWDHGGTWQGYAVDETSETGTIPLAALRLALQDIQPLTGRLEMLGFDACLMAALEVAHVCQPFARYLVASEEIEPGEGWPYDEVLEGLVTNPRMSIREFAAAIPSAYQASMDLRPPNGETTTLSAVDLDRLPALVAAVDAFADEMLAEGVFLQYEGLGRAHFRTDKYTSMSAGGAGETVDLGDLAAQVAAAPGTPAAVIVAANAVAAAVQAAVVARDSGAVHADATGLSIYFPRSDYSLGYAAMNLADDTSWDEFVGEFVLFASADTTAPTLTVDGSSNLAGPTPLAPATMDLTIGGNDAIDLQGWVVQDAGAGFVDILGAVSQDEAFPGTATLEWDGSLIALSNGSAVSALPLFPVEPGACSVALGFVQYRRTPLASDEQLLVLVDCTTGGIVGFFGVESTPDGDVIAEVPLQPGSEIQVLFPRLDTSDESLELVAGITLALPTGAAGLVVTSGPAGSGTYGFLAMVTDIAGNTATEAVAVTIP